MRCVPPNDTLVGAIVHPEGPETVSLAPSPSAGYRIYAHSHNDYDQARPLHDALDNHFYSIEVDIWLVGDEILVAHDKDEYKGSLTELYLDPLQTRVEESGSLYGDGEPVCLWLDMKDSNPMICVRLHRLLRQYSIFTRFSDSEITPGPVTVILTGDAEMQVVDQFVLHPRPAARIQRGEVAHPPQPQHIAQRVLYLVAQQRR